MPSTRTYWLGSSISSLYTRMAPGLQLQLPHTAPTPAPSTCTAPTSQIDPPHASEPRQKMSLVRSNGYWTVCIPLSDDFILMIYLLFFSLQI